MKQSSSRRQFIKGTLGAIGATITARLSQLFPEVQPILAQVDKEAVSAIQSAMQLEAGELYGEFLLLQEGFPLPTFVKHPQLGPPVICGVGRANPHLTGYGTLYSTVEEVAASVDFPVYTFADLPVELRPTGGSVIRYNTGQVYAASVTFERFNNEVNLWETAFSIWMETGFVRPYPLWSSKPIEPDGPFIALEKTDSLPTPGIRIRTPGGQNFYWIQGGILYIIEQELGSLLSQNVQGELIGTLVQVP